MQKRKKTKKQIKVQDLKPKKDAKGGVGASGPGFHGPGSHGPGSHGPGFHGPTGH
jgi:hypothetical protein